MINRRSAILQGIGGMVASKSAMESTDYPQTSVGGKLLPSNTPIDNTVLEWIAAANKERDKAAIDFQEKCDADLGRGVPYHVQMMKSWSPSFRHHVTVHEMRRRRERPIIPLSQAMRSLGAPEWVIDSAKEMWGEE